jgi:hypothetical protein
MKTPSTTWFARSAMNWRSTRGVNWLDASCSAMMVTEKTTPVTVMMLPEMDSRTLFAPSALPPKSHHTSVTSESPMMSSL